MSHATNEKCTGRDSNPHAFRQWNLNPIRGRDGAIVAGNHGGISRVDTLRNAVPPAIPHPGSRRLGMLSRGPHRDERERSTTPARGAS